MQNTLYDNALRISTFFVKDVALMDIREEIDKYLNYCKNQKKLSQKTAKAYSIDLKQFISFFDQNQGESMTKAGICSYISELHKKYAPKTAKRKLASLRVFLNYLEFEEIIEVNPLRKIKTRFQEPKILPKVMPINLIETLLTTAHSQTLLAKTKQEKIAAWRDATVIELLFATGIRVSELCSLKAGDVDLESGCVNVMGKGSKQRMVHIGNPEVLSILQKYHSANLASISKCGFFFVNRLSNRLSEQSVRFILQNLCNKANISIKITPHMFRHSFATLLLEEDVDIRYIQKMLGHSSIQTTQIYTQVSTEKQRQILVVKHPRNKISIKN